MMPPGIGLHQHAMAAGRLDVEPDVVMVGVEQVPHGDVAEDDLAVGRGGPGRGEGAAMGFLGAHRALLGGLAEPPAFQAGGRGLERVFQEVGLDVGVDRHEVEEIERPPVRTVAPAAAAPSAIPFISSRYSGSNRRRNRASARSRRSCQASAGAWRAAIPRESRRMNRRDLGRHQPAVLVTALVRLSFDVQDDPAGLGVSIAGAIPLHRDRIHPVV